MSVMKYKDPSTGEVKKIFAPTIDAYTKTETYSKTESDTLLNGKAPAGYGLGANAVKVAGKGDTLDYDANLCVQNGWWLASGHVPNKPAGDGGYWDIFVCSNGNFVRQFAFARSVNSSIPDYVICKRERNNNLEWSDWEYVNPPMVVGVEYRTTERYQGKPVYTMLVNCGTLPASTIKTVSLDDTTARIFECKGYIPSASMTIPVNNINGGSESIDVYGYYSSIKLVTTDDRSSWTAYVTVKYTKTTD